MNIKKYGSVARKLSVSIIVFFSIIVGAILPIFNPGYASAAIQGVTAQQDRTILHALYRCLDPNRGSPGPANISSDHLLSNTFKRTTSADTINQDSMDSSVSGSFLDVAAVGYEIDSTDGNAACGGISITRAMRPIGKDKRWFWSQIYDFSNPVDNGSGSYSYHVRHKTYEDLLGTIRNLMNSRDLGIGEPEKQRRLATAFWICAQPAPNPPDKPTVTFGGKKYELRDGAPNEVSVGYDMEADNGKFECNTLLHWGNKAEMAAALSQNPPGSTPGSPGSTGGGAAGDSSASCDGQGLSLGWVICGVTEVVSNFGQLIFSSFIQPMMENTPLSLDPGNAFYKSWQGFRFLGNIMLIGSMLAIVYSQARGGGGGQ